MVTPDELRTAAAIRRKGLGYDCRITILLDAAATAWSTDRAIIALTESYRDAVAECNGIAEAEAALFAALAAREGSARGKDEG